MTVETPVNENIKMKMAYFLTLGHRPKFPASVAKGELSIKISHTKGDIFNRDSLLCLWPFVIALNQMSTSKGSQSKVRIKT